MQPTMTDAHLHQDSRSVDESWPVSSDISFSDSRDDLLGPAGHHMREGESGLHPLSVQHMSGHASQCGVGDYAELSAASGAAIPMSPALSATTGNDFYEHSTAGALSGSAKPWLHFTGSSGEEVAGLVSSSEQTSLSRTGPPSFRSSVGDEMSPHFGPPRWEPSGSSAGSVAPTASFHEYSSSRVAAPGSEYDAEPAVVLAASGLGPMLPPAAQAVVASPQPFGPAMVTHVQLTRRASYPSAASLPPPAAMHHTSALPMSVQHHYADESAVAQQQPHLAYRHPAPVLTTASIAITPPSQQRLKQESTEAVIISANNPARRYSPVQYENITTARAALVQEHTRVSPSALARKQKNQQLYQQQQVKLELGPPALQQQLQQAMPQKSLRLDISSLGVPPPNTVLAVMSPRAQAAISLQAATPRSSPAAGVTSGPSSTLSPTSLPTPLGTPVATSKDEELRRRTQGHTKLYSCNICNRVVVGHCGLVRHLRVHTGEKPFECPHCQKCFRQKSTLTSHLRLHTNERPFECSVCPMAFRHRGSLRSHIRKTHPEVAASSSAAAAGTVHSV